MWRGRGPDGLLMFPCVLPGMPKPQVTWRKGPSSEPLRDRPGLVVLDDGSLFLATVSPTDGGDYWCQATNEAGSVSRRAELAVYGEQGPQSWGRFVHTSQWSPRIPGVGAPTPQFTARRLHVPAPQGPEAGVRT